MVLLTLDNLVDDPPLAELREGWAGVLCQRMPGRDTIEGDARKEPSIEHSEADKVRIKCIGEVRDEKSRAEVRSGGEEQEGREVA